MLLATRKTKNNLVRTVLASGVLISSAVYINNAFAATVDIGVAGNTTTIPAGPGDKYDYTAGVQFNVFDGVNLGADTGVSIDDAGGVGGTTLIFEGSSNVAGSIGATNPISDLQFNGADTKLVAVTDATSAGAITFQNGGAVTFAGVLNSKGAVQGVGSGSVKVTGPGGQTDIGTGGDDLTLGDSFTAQFDDKTTFGQDVILGNSSHLIINGAGGGQVTRDLKINDTATADINNDYKLNRDALLTGTDATNRATLNLAADKTLTIVRNVTSINGVIAAGTLSTFNMTGGDLTLQGTSKATLQLGTLTGNASIENNSTINFEDTYTVTGTFGAKDKAATNLSAGKTLGIDGIATLADDSVTTSAGTLDFKNNVILNNNAKLTATGETNLAALKNLTLNNAAIANLATGTASQDVLLNNTSQINFGDDYTINKDLTVTGTDATNRAKVNITAGTIDVVGTAGFGSKFTNAILTVSPGATLNTKALSFLGTSGATLQLGTATGAGVIDGASAVNFNDDYKINGALGLGATADSTATATVAANKTLQVDGGVTVSNKATLNVLGTLKNDALGGSLTLTDTATVNLNKAQISNDIIQAAGTTLNFTGGPVAVANDFAITGAGNVGVSSGAAVTVNGALTNVGAVAKFTFDLGDTDTPGTITAAGNADIVGTQTVTLLNYDLSKLSVGAAETKDLIVSAGGMTVGLTPQLVENLSNVFIKFTLNTPDTQHLQLVATRQVPTGLEGNANSLGGVLAQIDDTNTSGALLQLVNGVGDIANSPEALNEELAEIAPQGINGSLVDSAFGVTNETFDLFSQRINELRAGLDSYNTGYAAGHMTEKGHGTWVKVFGSHADQNRRGNIAGYTGETWGLAGGADIMITERHLVGVSLAWASTDVNFDSQRGGNDINSYQGAFYGSWNVTTPLYVNWMASAAFNKYKETQIISTGGFNQTNLGEFDGWQYGARAEAGYIFGEECFHIIPTVDLTYTHASFDSFRQKGNSNANQVIDYGSVSALLAGVGVKFSYDYEMEKALLQPEAHVNVSYDIIGDEMDANSRFVGFGTSYNVQGASVKRTDYNVGLSLTTYGDSGLGFSISYDYDWKSGFHAHSGFARIRYEW